MTTDVGGGRADLREVQEVLERLTEHVSQARSMPMSASCVVNREQVLALVEDVRRRLPHVLLRAQEVLGDRDAVVVQGNTEAERLIAAAHAEQARIMADTEVLQRAHAEAERVMRDARQQAESLRTESEHFVDAKLATFEVVLGKTAAAVARGRAQLAGAGVHDALREEPAEGAAQAALAATAGTEPPLAR